MGLQSDLQVILSGLDGVSQAFFQSNQLFTMGEGATYIVYEHSGSHVVHADNILYRGKKRYTVTVIHRRPDSLVPDMVEALPYSTFDRKFVRNGLNHSIFQLYF